MEPVPTRGQRRFTVGFFALAGAIQVVLAIITGDSGIRWLAGIAGVLQLSYAAAAYWRPHWVWRQLREPKAQDHQDA